MRVHPFFVWCLLLLAMTAARAAVQIEDHVQHYDIDGNSPADLRREMNAKGPMGSGGRRFDGYTRWYVSWQYRYNRTDRGCAIDSVSTHVKVTMTLPRWNSQRWGNDATRQQWGRHLTALELHEQGHRRHGIDAGHEVDRAIAAMPPAAHCDALGAAANALGASILKRYNQRDLDYDRETQHGATQGARFP